MNVPDKYNYLTHFHAAQLIDNESKQTKQNRISQFYGFNNPHGVS